MVNSKQGNIKFDPFWKQLRDCFDGGKSSATEKVAHHAIVVSEKPAGRYELTMNKRTPLMGKAGPDNLASVSVRTIRQNPFRMISVLQRANKCKTYSRLWGSWSRIQKSPEREQGQGRQDNSDTIDSFFSNFFATKSLFRQTPSFFATFLF